MAPRTDLAIYLDLECTGSADDAEIVEFGAVAVELPSFKELSAFETIVIPTPARWDDMDEVVVTMHRKSGLFDDITDGMGVPLAELDGLAIDWLQSLVGKNTTHVPYGGSGVAHYDRKYIRRDMPRFDKRITHWPLDSGVLRRAFRMAKVKWLESASEGVKTHRALDDARMHAAEFKYAVDVIAIVGQVMPIMRSDEEGTGISKSAAADF